MNNNGLKFIRSVNPILIMKLISHDVVIHITNLLPVMHNEYFKLSHIYRKRSIVICQIISLILMYKNVLKKKCITDALGPKYIRCPVLLNMSHKLSNISAAAKFRVNNRWYDKSPSFAL